MIYICSDKLITASRRSDNRSCRASLRKLCQWKLILTYFIQIQYILQVYIQIEMLNEFSKSFHEFLRLVEVYVYFYRKNKMSAILPQVFLKTINLQVHYNQQQSCCEVDFTKMLRIKFQVGRQVPNAILSSTKIQQTINNYSTDIPR